MAVHKDDIIKTDDLISPSEIFYRSFFSSMKEFGDELTFLQETKKAIDKGKITFYQKSMWEAMSFDEAWIETLMSYFPSIDKIVNNPRKGLKYEEEIVNVEKAKKINALSIRHLASHTHMIKEVTDGNVKPKTILTTYAEDEFHLYENRFVKTLIIRVFHFIIKRYTIIKEQYQCYRQNRVKMTNEFSIDKSTITFDIDIAIKSDLENGKVQRKNDELMAKIEHLHKCVVSYMNSEFMLLLKQAKEVKSPIMKTNVILKNVDFRNCYTLWLFMERYDALGFEVQSKEKNSTIVELFQEDLKNLSALSLATMVHYFPRWIDLSFGEDVKEKIKKQKLMKKSLPDEGMIDPGKLEFKDNSVNEFFFNQTKKFFQDNLEETLEAGNTYEQSLRSVYKNMLNVTNALYKSLFELTDEESDYFNPKLKTSTTQEQIMLEKRKMKIVKQVRQMKEADLKQTAADEVKIAKNIEKLLSREKAEKEKAIRDKAKAVEQAKTKQAKAAEQARLQAELEKKRIEDSRKQEIARQKAQARREVEKERAAERARVERDKKKAADAILKAKEREKAKAKQVQAREKQKLEQQRRRERMKTSKFRNITARKRGDSTSEKVPKD